MRNAGLLRRLGAVLYDSLLVAALLFMATIPFIAIRGGEAVDPPTLTYQLSMLAVAYAFFVSFWSRSGSTLGMLAWGLRVETHDGASPGFAKASLRFFAAILSWLALGLGFLWQLWDKDDLTWHDRLSGTRLRYYPKNA
ncbi:MAG: RDD family protein [Woeseiaceae bacterium]|nr:RDD family protein [Woeseiaceae bacterium]